MRSLFIFVVLLMGCGAAPPAPVERDVTQESWYRDSTAQLIELMRQAEDAYKEKDADQAAALIQQAEPLAKRLMDTPKPTVAAVEAASDLDDLYGRMLLANRHYGWARLEFQKNLARWKNWTPQTDESRRRLRLAIDAIKECDRHIQ